MVDSFPFCCYNRSISTPRGVIAHVSNHRMELKKLEIADAFRQVTPLLAKVDQVIYSAMLKQMGVDRP